MFDDDLTIAGETLTFLIDMLMLNFKFSGIYYNEMKCSNFFIIS